MGPFSPLHVIASAVFIYFWLVTLAPATNSWKVYKYRTMVVAAYAVFTWADHHHPYSNWEWAASCLVWSHFVSFVTVFVYGDPRLKRHKNVGL
jgi:hypothetical protein